MPRTKVILYSLGIALGLAVLGWSLYPSLLALAAPGTVVAVVTNSPEHALTLRAANALALFLTGLACGIGARFMTGARHSPRAYWRGVLTLLLIGGAVFLTSASMVGPDAMATSPVDGMPQAIQLPVDALPVWKAGVWALAAVVLAAGFVAFTRRK
jgi:hypothetical protein